MPGDCTASVPGTGTEYVVPDGWSEDRQGK